MDVGLYIEDGANIMNDYGWMEQPPEAAYNCPVSCITKRLLQQPILLK
ncbi:hypothetical protein [Peribacillus butanolivorans]